MTIRNQHIQTISLLSIKEDVSKIISKYQQKITNSLSYQNNLLCTQVDHMKSVVRHNQDRLIQQKLQIDDLAQKIKTIQARTQSKLLLLSKQLQNFKKYYDQCYQYTMKRINQVYDKVNVFCNQICKDIKNNQIGSVIQYVKYTNQMLINIVKGASIKNNDLKFYLDQQLFQLETKLGNFMEYFENFDKIVDQLKTSQFGNDSLKQTIQAAMKMIEGNKQSQSEMNNSQVGKKLLGYFQPKFKQIIKKINSYSMEIQLVKSMINCQNNQTRTKNEIKQKQFVQLQQKLDELQQLVQDEKKNYQRNLAKKQQILKKRHDRILELQESMHKLLDKELKMQHQMAELKLHNLQFSKQIKRTKMKEMINIEIQTDEKSLKNSNTKTPEKNINRNQQEKMLLLEIQYQNLAIKYQQQQNQLNALKKQMAKHSKDSLQTKLAKSQKIRSQQDDFEMMSNNPKQERSKSKSKPKDSRNTKSCIRISPLDTKSTVKINKYNEKNQNKLLIENQQLIRINQQLNKSNKELQIQIMNLLKNKSKQNQQDDLYLDEIQAQLQKNTIQIQRLMADNVQLTQKNNQLQDQILRLYDDINTQSQNFQLKSKNYKSLVSKLQHQYQTLFVKNKQLIKKLSQYEDMSGSDHYDQRKHLFFENTFSQSMKNVYNCSSLSKDSKSTKTKEKRKRKPSNFITELQHAILSMGLPIPIICQIDSNGFIRQQKTGTYLVDQSKNPLILNEGELNAAIEEGLILM